MGRAGRPKGGMPPGLEELGEHGLPGGWHRFWHGSRQKIASGDHDVLGSAGYEMNAEGDFLRSSSEEEKTAARKPWIDPLSPYWKASHEDRYRSGLVPEDYSVCISPDGSGWRFTIARENEPGYVDVGEFDNLRKGLASIDGIIEEHVATFQSAAEAARHRQSDLVQLFEDKGIDDFSLNSPTGEMLLATGKMEPTLEEPERLLPDMYRIDIYPPLARQVGGGSDTFAWRVCSPKGDVLKTGESASQEEAEDAAKKVRDDTIDRAMSSLKKRYRQYQKHKEVFKGLDATWRWKAEGFESGSEIGKVNVAASPYIHSLHREDLREGYSVVVGSRKTPVGDGDVLLVFRRGEIVEQAGLDGRVQIKNGLGTILPGARRRELLQEARKMADSCYIRFLSLDKKD